MSSASITKTVGNIRYEYERDMDSQGYTLFVYNAQTGQLLSSASTNRRDDGGTFQAAGQALIDEAISRLRTQNNPLAAEAISYLSSQGRSDIAELDRKYDALFPPPPATPTIDNTATPANTAPTGSNTLQGTASDDSGVPPPIDSSLEGSPEFQAQNAATASTVLPSGAPPQPGTERESPTGDSSSSNTTGNPPYENETFIRVTEAPITTPGGRPGRRLKNPLGSLASYTYQLSLYMISPSAYEAFVASGRRNINLYGEQLATNATTQEQQEAASRNGAFLIAQSGGIGDKDQRAPGFEYDYYIDNLSFSHFASSRETGSAVANIDYKFDIIEPYGFSLLTKLRRAKEFISGEAGGPDPLRQFFILGVRFFGWDQAGRQVLGPEIFDGNPVDPAAPGNGALFESFFDIEITEFKFKINGSATVYNIKAAHKSIAATINMRKGMINTIPEVSGSTVRDYLSGPNGLITKLNQEQQNLKNNGTVTYPTVYKIRWLGDAERIATASMISPGQTNKAAQAASATSNTTQVTPAAETRASPNSSSRILSFANIPIIQAIEQVISQSSYLQNAMAFNYTDSNENNPNTSAPNIELTPNQEFTWFHISPSISDIEWDDDINDWAYAITYTIQTYLIPSIDNPFVTNNTPYYGPHKRYDYWYTGQNTEILKFEQEIKNGFFNIVTAGTPTTSSNPNNTTTTGTNGTTSSNNATGGTTTGSGSVTPTATNTTTPVSGDGSAGTLSLEAVNSVKTTLYDPDSYATAKIEILGDPDFLMQPATSLNDAVGRSNNSSTQFNRFYSDGGFVVNANGGRVFFEIDFKEPVDYSATTVSDLMSDGRGISGVGGTLSINDSIMFINYRDGVTSKINGVIYELNKITSTFKNGTFIQNLEATQPFLHGDLTNYTPPAEQTREDPPSTVTSAGTTAGTPGQNSNPGTRPDPAPAPQPAPAPAPTVTTRTLFNRGPFADGYRLPPAPTT